LKFKQFANVATWYRTDAAGKSVTRMVHCLN